MNLKEVYTLYYYHYLYFLHQFFQNGKWKYEFRNLLNYNFFQYGLDVAKADFDNFKYNPYITTNKKDHSALGKDILQNGMYFPFFCFKDKDLNKRSVLLGRHRLYSLLLNESLIKNKEFLFLELPYYSFHDVYNSEDYIPSIKCITIENHQIVFKILNNQKDTMEAFVTLSDTLPKLIYPYRDKIKPNSIFNNEKLFKEFIENPFNISLKRIQKEAEVL